MILGIGVCWELPKDGDTLEVNAEHANQGIRFPLLCQPTASSSKGQRAGDESKALGVTVRWATEDKQAGRPVSQGRWAPHAPTPTPRTVGLLAPPRPRGHRKSSSKALGIILESPRDAAPHGVGLPAACLPVRSHDADDAPGSRHRGGSLESQKRTRSAG